MEISLAYDPTLLDIKGITKGLALPTGANLVVNIDQSLGRVTVVINSPIAFALKGKALSLLSIDAEVPASAAYGQAEVIDVEMSINGGAVQCRSDDAVHVAAYLGDVNGDGVINASDVDRLKKVSSGREKGFAAYAAILPGLIGDFTTSPKNPKPNGVINAQDIKALQDEIIGRDRVEIPAIPTGINTTFDLGTKSLLNASTQPVSVSAPKAAISAELTVAKAISPEIEAVELLIAGVDLDQNKAAQVAEDRLQSKQRGVSNSTEDTAQVVPRIKWTKAQGNTLHEIKLDERADWLQDWVNGNSDKPHPKLNESWKITLPKS